MKPNRTNTTTEPRLALQTIPSTELRTSFPPDGKRQVIFNSDGLQLPDGGGNQYVNADRDRDSTHLTRYAPEGFIVSTVLDGINGPCLWIGTDPDCNRDSGEFKPFAIINGPTLHKLALDIVRFFDVVNGVNSDELLDAFRQLSPDERALLTNHVRVMLSAQQNGTPQ